MDKRSLNMLPDSMVVYTVTEIDTEEAQSRINSKNPYRQNAVHSTIGLHKDVAEDSTATLIRTQVFDNPYRKAIANRRQQEKQQRPTKHDAHCVSRRDLASSFNHDNAQSAGSIATGNKRDPLAEPPRLSIMKDKVAQVKDLDRREDPTNRDIRDAVDLNITAPPAEKPRRDIVISPYKLAERSNEADANFVKEGRTVDLGFNASQIRNKVLQLRVKNELSALRNVQLNFVCQRCRLQGLQCNRAKPSCWNCEQKFQQCSYKYNEIGTSAGEDSQHVEIPVESISDSISWLDSLRKHPYYTVDEEQKISQFDRLSLEVRYPHRDSRPIASHKNNKRVKVETTEQEKKEEEKALLLEIYWPALSEDDTSSTTEVNTPAETSSPRSPSTNKLVNSYCSMSPSSGSQYTISLIFSDNLVFSDGSRSSVSTCPTSLGDDSVRPTSLRSDSNSFHPRPRLFQCTFCLRQCNDQQDWEQHEETQHRQREWICMPWGPTGEPDGDNTCVFCDAINPDASHSSQHKVESCFSRPTENRTFRDEEEFQEHLRIAHNQSTVTQHMQDQWWWHPEDTKYYWNCGFCDLLLTSWSKRVEHIGSHFKDGTVMSSWDPLMPPYPLDKDTLVCAARFPPVGWDARTLWALQFEKCNQAGRPSKTEEHHHCQHCDAHFASKADAKRHEEIWHSLRYVWSCPTMSDVRAAIHLQTGPLAQYLFPTSQSPTESDEDACPYCGHEFDNDEDWDVHIEHLKDQHSIDKCDPPHKFHRPEHLVIHLANVHNVMLSERFADIVDSCGKAERTLVIGTKGSMSGRP